MTKKKASPRDYTRMNKRQLAAATRKFDREIDLARDTRPLTAAERAKWKRAKRKRGRPVVGNGSERISVSIERTLLAKTDRLAKRKQVSRSELIAAALRAVLSGAADVP